MVTSEKVRKVADTLAGLLWGGVEVPIDMVQTTTNPSFDWDPEAMQVAGCVGCCYALALSRQGVAEAKGKHFVWGSAMLDADIGALETKDSLVEIGGLPTWAHDNPDIWGNYYGTGAYCANEAYGILNNEDATLNKVVKHFYAVADRLEAKEIGRATATKPQMALTGRNTRNKGPLGEEVAANSPLFKEAQ